MNIVFSGKKVESGGRPKDRKTKEPVKEEHQPLFATELGKPLIMQVDIFKPSSNQNDKDFLGFLS